MARRRTVQQEEKMDFLYENPQLIEFDTQIDTAKDGEDIPRLRVTNNDNETELVSTTPIFEEPDLFSAEFVIEGENFLLFPNDPFILPPFDLGADSVGPSFVDHGSDEYDFGAILLSENGIGVISEEEFEEADEEDFDSEEEAILALGSLGPDESLNLLLPGSLFFGPGFSVLDEEPCDDFCIPPEILEGRDLSVDFTVVEGSGEIVLTFYDFGFPFFPAASEPGALDYGPWLPEMEVQSLDPAAGSRRRSDDANRFEAESPEGGFDWVEISTTGTLEIFVTGIDLTTGIADELFLI